MTDRVAPPPTTVPPGTAAARGGDDHKNKEVAMAAEPVEIDEQALVLRLQSTRFGKIAEALGLPRASDANEAFNRALRRRPPEEQARIRSDENGRLDRLRDAVAADTKRTKEEIAKRLRAIERLRGRLMNDERGVTGSQPLD